MTGVQTCALPICFPVTIHATEALDWLNQLDRQHNLTDKDYGIGDFIEDLKQNGYLTENEQDGSFKITAKSEQTIRKKSLEEIFGKLKKSKQGNHQTNKPGPSSELNPDTRAFQFGDMLEQIDFTESIRNAQINRGADLSTRGPIVTGKQIGRAHV